MLQGAGGKGVSEIVKSGGGAARPFQYGGQLLPHRGGVQRGVLFLRGWEHQWELTLCRYCARISKTGAGRRMLRQEARVLGWETASFPWMR